MKRRTKLKKVSNDYRFDLDYHKIGRQLAEITRHANPSDLLNEMARRSLD